MSDVLLKDEHKMIQQTAREFAQKEVALYAAECDREAKFPKSGIQKCAELGFMGIAVPEQYGGSGLDYFSYVLVLEEIAAVCASTAVIVSVNNSLVCTPLKTFGNEWQKTLSPSSVAICPIRPIHPQIHRRCNLVFVIALKQLRSLRRWQDHNDHLL